MKKEDIKVGMIFSHGDESILEIIKLNSRFNDENNNNCCKTRFLRLYFHNANSKELSRYYETNYDALIDPRQCEFLSLSEEDIDKLKAEVIVEVL